MQDVEQIHETAQASGTIETQPIGHTHTLCITVTPNKDCSAADSELYCLQPSDRTFLFDGSHSDASCRLECLLVDADGNPFPAKILNFRRPMFHGGFFKNKKPIVSGKGSNALTIDFDFSDGNVAGTLDLEVSDGQMLSGIKIINASPDLERANQYATLTITQTKGGGISHSPLSGIRFNNASKHTPSILFCILIGPDGRPSRDAFFTSCTYTPIDDSTWNSSLRCEQKTNVFAIWFDFKGVASGGALTVYVSPHGSAGSIPVDPQVVNVPTTGGSPGLQSQTQAKDSCCVAPGTG